MEPGGANGVNAPERDHAEAARLERRGRPAGQHEEASRRVLNFLAAVAATVAPDEDLLVYDTETGRETTVRVVADPDVPSGWRYAFV